MTSTHVTTYTLMNPWASTIPWDCLVVPDTKCCHPTHKHDPMVGDLCAAGCGHELRRGEECYAVTEISRRPDGRESWVCWRHVRPDEGPCVVDTGETA